MSTGDISTYWTVEANKVECIHCGFFGGERGIEPKPSGSQGLFQALCSGMMPGDALGTIGISWNLSSGCKTVALNP